MHRVLIFKSRWGWMGVAASERGLAAIVLPRVSRSAVAADLPPEAGTSEGPLSDILWSARNQLTEYLAGRIDALPDFERLGEVETAVCCFRHKSRSDQRLQQIIERKGEVWLTTTVLHGRRALRVNVNSFLTEQHHIDQLVTQIQKAAATL